MLPQRRQFQPVEEHYGQAFHSPGGHPEAKETFLAPAGLTLRCW